MTNSKSSDKSFSPNNQTQQNNNTDSKTKVYIRLDEPKITVSFRCNRELWKSFKKQIRAQGLSICHVLEPMIFGWLNGYVNICDTIKPLKIENLVVERAVKRVRRYGVEDVEAAGSNPGDVGRFVDFYDEATLWKRVKVEDDSDVNEHGHLVGCQCSVCRKEVTQR